ncbi:NUDIX domain-containing protein [Pseudonocardia nantongensis]|uniref:NUDIX domain-containing protein n=1 Tax=Pseudonocardia nantongensis TaxID=1181885 RepID=UPI00397C1DC1
MPVRSLDHHVPGPPRLVAGVLREAAPAAAAVTRAGARLEVPTRLLVAGDEVEIVLAGGLLRCRARITRAGTTGLVSGLAAGPVAALRHATVLAPSGSGTAVRDELSWTPPLGPPGRLSDPVLGRFARRLLDARRDALAARTAELVTAPAVVGAAMVRDGRVLVAQRSYPAELAGRWELPGGGVEAGETGPEALARECREELGAGVRVGGRVGTDLPIGRRVLRVYRADLEPGSPEPVAREHRALCWAGPREIATLAWLDADRAVVAELLDLLRRRPSV